MQRLDVRCKVDLPVSVTFGNGSAKEIVEKKSRFSELSLSGGYLACRPPYPDKKIIGLRYELPKYGEFEISGEVVRKEQKGLAIRFCSVGRDAKLKLWDYIRGNLVEGTRCPYCNGENTRRQRRCKVCGWSLNFNSPAYLFEHEKESFIHRIAMKCREVSLEDIYRILSFIDVEVLRIGRGLEINGEFIGSSRPMLEVFSGIRNVATTDLPVLIIGESGTGKKFTARTIHERSLRRDKPLVPIECRTIPGGLIEAELFGYEKGTLPSTCYSKLEYADGGTIFLNEVGGLPLTTQSKLLRFLENRIIKRAGARSGERVDVRIITANETDLKEAVAQGTFSAELFHGLNTFTINLPPVRERGDDKIILSRYFLNKFSKEMGVVKTFSPDAIDSIKSYNWPGNVREIINRARRAVLLSDDMTVTARDMDLYTIPPGGIASLKEVKRNVEKEKLLEALSFYNNNISKVAKALCISRPTVYNLKKRLGI